MASMAHSTIQNAMKKVCLEVPEVASQCRIKRQKARKIAGLAVF
jgi:hypothetical protein